MSGHADTIRAAIDAAMIGWPGQDQARAELDALLVENQRYEKALLNVASYGDQTSITLAETDRMVRYAREALAGDT